MRVRVGVRVRVRVGGYLADELVVELGIGERVGLVDLEPVELVLVRVRVRVRVGTRVGVRVKVRVRVRG